MALNLFGNDSPEKEIDETQNPAETSNHIPPGEKMIAAYEGISEGALYKNASVNNPEDYLGGVARGARLQLLKKEVLTDEYGRLVIEVKLLTNPVSEKDNDIIAPASPNDTGWIELEQTGFRNFYDPDKQVIKRL